MFQGHGIAVRWFLLSNGTISMHNVRAMYYHKGTINATARSALINSSLIPVPHHFGNPTGPDVIAFKANAPTYKLERNGRAQSWREYVVRLSPGPDLLHSSNSWKGSSVRCASDSALSNIPWTRQKDNTKNAIPSYSSQIYPIICDATHSFTSLSSMHLSQSMVKSITALPRSTASLSPT